MVSFDLNTADGLVRSMALAVEGFEQREEVKKSISLAQIQTDYFGFIERNFGHFHKIMLEKGMTPSPTSLLARTDQSRNSQRTFLSS